MKKIAILSMVFFTTMVIAQPVAPIFSPMITDVPLTVLSATSSATYGGGIIAENNLQNSVKAYAKTYNKRATYYAGAVIILKINKNLKENKKRLKILKQKNKKLPPGTKKYSTRAKNEHLLAEVEENLEILEEELEQQDKMVIYGEKLNLLQNTMRTLTKISKTLDLVEKQIKDKEYLIKEVINPILRKAN